MKTYLITGIAGTGKSAVGTVLAQKSYYVLETDRVADNKLVYRGRYDVRTNEISQYTRGDGWQELQYVRWNIKLDVLRAELQAHASETIFVCGYANNWHELASDFDGIFLLEAKPQAIEHRLLTRTTGDWGRKHPEELKHALETARDYNRSIKGLGATVIDADQPLENVVSTILGSL